MYGSMTTPCGNITIVANNLPGQEWTISGM